MTEVRPAAPDSACKLCGGGGYLLAAVGEGSQASVCACIPRCAACKGSGRIVLTAEGVARVGRCRCQLVPDRVALFNRAGIPGRFVHATLRSFMAGFAHDPKKGEAFQPVARWFGAFRPESGRGLVLHGPVGRGKTHLLVALLRQMIFERGVAVRFIEFSRLLGLLREGYDAGRSDAAIFRELTHIPVLAIDELGKGRSTDWELSVIDELISRRYNAMTPVLATTNYRPGDPSGAPVPNLAQVNTATQTLGDRIGDRCMSRLREMSDFVEVGGLDFRELKGLGRLS
jgi:DNA replication protein DnaC